MKNTVFLAVLIVGTLSASAAFATPGNGEGWGNGDGGGKDHNAPLPIAALGLPFAMGLLGYAIRRRKA